MMNTLTEALGAFVLVLVAVAILLGLVAVIIHEWAWLRRGLAKLRTPDPYEAFWRDQEATNGRQ
jgi:hypothetical protein